MTYSLITDGSSDKVLVPILTWSLKQYVAEPVVDQWVDFTRIPRQPNRGARLRAALDLYPCDVLFVHRDAESQPVEWRRGEIATDLKDIFVVHVPVVPVRMSEAWLLVDERSIRSAAGNPNGNEELMLPKLENLEKVPDPEKVLHEALIKASGRNHRRQLNFSPQQRVHLISHYIDDYSVLHALPAFQLLHRDIRSTLNI